MPTDNKNRTEPLRMENSGCLTGIELSRSLDAVFYSVLGSSNREEIMMIPGKNSTELIYRRFAYFKPILDTLSQVIVSQSSIYYSSGH